MQVFQFLLIEMLVFLLTPYVTNDLTFVLYPVLFLWDHSIWEQSTMIPICVFTNPALRFVYVGYCGVLDHCFECTEERIQTKYCCSVLSVQFEITQI